MAIVHLDVNGSSRCRPDWDDLELSKDEAQVTCKRCLLLQRGAYPNARIAMKRVENLKPPKKYMSVKISKRMHF